MWLKVYLMLILPAWKSLSAAMSFIGTLKLSTSQYPSVYRKLSRSQENWIMFTQQYAAYSSIWKRYWMSKFWSQIRRCLHDQPLWLLACVLARKKQQNWDIRREEWRMICRYYNLGESYTVFTLSDFNRKPRNIGQKQVFILFESWNGDVYKDWACFN